MKERPRKIRKKLVIYERESTNHKHQIVKNTHEVTPEK